MLRGRPVFEKRWVRGAVVLVALPWVFLTLSCGQKTPGDSFFPLDEGRAWTYRVSKQIDEALEPNIEILKLDTRGMQTLESGPAMRRHTDNGLDYWLKSDDSGIYRVASRNPLEEQPKSDNPPRYVLKKPFVVGTQWEGSTVAYILQRRNEVPKEVRYTHKPVMMVYRIESLDQTVETPAGKFEGCLRVAGEAKIKLYVDALFMWRDIPLFSTEWYCPGVGLVKVERVETSPSKFMLGGRMTLELTQWH
jgi:hypothetical protein